jgi:ribosome-associated translation inhibitor RaiA
MGLRWINSRRAALTYAHVDDHGEEAMQSPLQIMFRHMDPSPALEARIRQRAAELDQFFGRIIACRVVVECRHPRHSQGNLFEVRIDLTLPGSEVVAGSGSGVNHAHEDPHVAVRDAFDALRRRVEDHARVRRGEIKRHGDAARDALPAETAGATATAPDRSG